MANKTYSGSGVEAGVPNTKMRVEQIKSEDGFTSLAVDLEALRGQVKDIIGAANYKEEITGEYAKVQIVDLAAHIDASGAASLAIKQDMSLVGAADFNGALDVAGASDLHGAVYAYSTFRADGAVDINAAMDVSGASDLHGAVKAYSTLEVDGESTLASAIIEDITAQHIMFAGAAHEVNGSASLKWDGTDLIVGSAKVSDLTATRVTFAGADGALMDDAKMSFAAGVLTVSGSTYGNSSSIVGDLTVGGNFVVEGSYVTQNVETVTAVDPLITLNKDAASIPAGGSGIEFEASGSIAGYVKTNASGDMLIKAAAGNVLTLDVNADKKIAVEGDLTIEAASFVNQDLTTDAMPEFTKAKLSTLTASRLMASNGSKETVSADLNSWVAGTTNQVNVADDADGSITLSLPQDIHLGATPTFVNVKHSGLVGQEGKAMKIALSGTIAPAAWNEFIEVQANVGLFLSQSALKAQVQLAQDIRTTASPTFAGTTFGSYGAITAVGGGADLKLAAVTGSLKFDDSFRAASTFGQPLRLAGAAEEWSAIETAYGNELSLLAMLAAAAPSTNSRKVAVTEISSASYDFVIAASANWPAAISMTGGKSDVYVNGQLQVEGAGKDYAFVAAGSDSAKITFTYQLQNGDVVKVIRYPAAVV